MLQWPGEYAHEERDWNADRSCVLPIIHFMKEAIEPLIRNLCAREPLGFRGAHRFVCAVDGGGYSLLAVG
jgi:hypothetical protein